MKKNEKALIRHNLIYQRFNIGETVNVGELAEDSRVSIRTIQKDINIDKVIATKQL